MSRHIILIPVFCMIQMLCLLLLPVNVSAAASNSYSIVLASAPGTNLTWEAKAFPGKKLYVEPATIKGASWERLCLGFFSTRKQAASSLTKVKKDYPGAWIQKTSNKKFRFITGTAVAIVAKPIAKRVKATTKKRAVIPSSSYSVVMASSPGSGLNWEAKNNSAFSGRSVYVEKIIVKGLPWERLCLGFFSTRKQAASLLKKVKKDYPGAWIQKTSKKDFRYITGGASRVKSVSKRPAAKIPAFTMPKTSLADEKLGSLMKRAKTDFKNKRYSSAIRYLNALLSMGKHKYSREALELLGLARQRKGQKTHAVTTYEKYLTLYPDDDGADRVRQRLAGLLTAASAPRSKLRMATIEEVDELTTFGSLSQFYRVNRTTTDDIGNITTLSQLNTFIDVTTEQRLNKFDHRYQFTADHTNDFIGDKDSSEFRFIETYYELSYRKTGTSGRFGRQSLRIGGLLKRFDGLSAGYQFTPDMRLNVLGGFPVDIDNKTSINDNKTFYGITFETGTFLEHWEMNMFYFDQTFDGLNDRQSLGTELRYRDDSKSLFGMIDYDLFYEEVNILQFNANLILGHGRTAYMNAFMRKSPILATSNALIGRSERTLDELKKTLNIEQIYQLARDRTANSQTVTVGGAQPISEKFQVTGDITLSRVGDTVASGGVLATPSTGTDYFISTQLVGNSLLVKRDTGVLGIRYFNTKPSNTISLIANSRFPITRNWRLNPRLQYDIRKLSDGRSQEKLRVIIRTDFRYLNKARFDFEIGYDETSEDNGGILLGNNNLFFSMGYRWDF